MQDGRAVLVGLADSIPQSLADAGAHSAYEDTGVWLEEPARQLPPKRRTDPLEDEDDH